MIIPLEKLVLSPNYRPWLNWHLGLSYARIALRTSIRLPTIVHPWALSEHALVHFHGGASLTDGQGVIVGIVAVGNEAKTQVGYPAFYAFSEGLSVSAMGRKGTFPPGSHEESDIGTKFGTTDSNNFVARFTNTGDVSLIGPGVGIISTVPGGYGVMSGTSMACPAVTGMIAGMLSADHQRNGTQAIIEQTPDANRTSAMVMHACQAAQKVFNDAKAEGDGLLR